MARLTLASLSSKTCACAESSKKIGKSIGKATVHRQLKGQAHIGHSFFKNLACLENSKKANKSLGSSKLQPSSTQQPAKLKFTTFSLKTCTRKE
jgi:hypothetical protein